MALRGRRTGRWVERAARRLLDTLLPPLCPGCHRELLGSRWICGCCRRRLRPVGGRRVCWICRQEGAGSGREAGLDCAREEHRPHWGGAAFWMEPPLDALVHSLKYGGRPDLARPLGRLLGAGVSTGADLVTGIPLHRTRRRDRGYNQASLLAREASWSWGVPHVETLLVRDRSTRAQARLPRPERAGNVGGAFVCRTPSWVRGRQIVLVDDVATSGSTLLAAASPLWEAGAERVLGVALALA